MVFKKNELTVKKVDEKTFEVTRLTIEDVPQEVVLTHLEQLELSLKDAEMKKVDLDIQIAFAKDGINALSGQPEIQAAKEAKELAKKAELEKAGLK